MRRTRRSARLTAASAAAAADATVAPAVTEGGHGRRAAVHAREAAAAAAAATADHGDDFVARERIENFDDSSGSRTPARSRCAGDRPALAKRRRRRCDVVCRDGDGDGEAVGRGFASAFAAGAGEPPPTLPWCELVRPRSMDELVTPPAKRNEVRAWMERCVAHLAAPRSAAFCARLLVLAGPPGTGMSTMVNVVAASALQMEVVEWRSPVMLPYDDRPVDGEYSAPYQSLLEHLRGFLVDARYPSLVRQAPARQSAVAEGTHASRERARLIVIDDLPVDVFDGSGDHQRGAELRDVMGRLARASPHPIIVILSDDSRGRMRAARAILGEELLVSPWVAQTSVNPVAPRYMKKALARAVEILGIEDTANECVADVVGAIAGVSDGDLRSALLSLQMLYAGTGRCRYDAAVAGRRNVQKRAKRANGAALGAAPATTTTTTTPALPPLLDFVGRGAGVETFHTVGKILHDKNESERPDAPESVEQIIERSTTEPTLLMAFVHQNFAEHFSDIADAAAALQCLSDADVIGSGWRTRLPECAAIVAARGVRARNLHRAPSAFRPVRAPLRPELEAQRERERMMAAMRYRLRRACGRGAAIDLANRAVACELEPMRRRIRSVGEDDGGGGGDGGSASPHRGQQRQQFLRRTSMAAGAPPVGLDAVSAAELAIVRVEEEEEQQQQRQQQQPGQRPETQRERGAAAADPTLDGGGGNGLRRRAGASEMLFAAEAHAPANERMSIDDGDEDIEDFDDDGGGDDNNSHS